MDLKDYGLIEDALKDRADWETRQHGFYMLRYGGFQRSNKPYPNAPDMHYPLADTVLDKLKPLFVQQLYAQETFCSFIATKEQPPENTTAAAEWFDWQLKQRSNFETEIFGAIDQFLEAGFITVKVYWHADKKAVCFSAIDNLKIVVPTGTEELQDADWFVHIIELSKDAYRRNDKYEAPLEELTGKSNQAGQDLKDQGVNLREGIHFSKNDDSVILWECYRRNSDKWRVETVSPVRGCERPVRASFGLPYEHNKLPFFRLRTELTKKGWYSPRGIPEILAPYQMAMKKLWDSSLQFLDYHGIPTYVNKSSNAIPNTKNFQPQPGGILPPGLEPSIPVGAPADYERQMGMTRAVAEDRVQIPDLGASEHLVGKSGKSGDVTATQINAIVGQSGQANDMRARIFRMDVAEGFSLAWALYCQFSKDQLSYLQNSQIMQVDQAALHLEYVLMPNGSPDSWNKAQQLSKAIARFQMFKGDPFARQGELRKSVFELDDSSLVKRLYTDPGAELKAQGEQQAQEISIMLLGFPAEVSDADDDKAHLVNLGQFVERRHNTGEPITPETARLFLEHGSGHVGGLTKKKDPALQQITKALMPVVQILEQLAQIQGQGAPQGQNGSAPTGQNGTEAPEHPNPKDAADLQQEDQKIEIQKGNMLVNASKAGFPVSHGEFNEVLRRLGLPDLPDAPLLTAPPVPHTAR